jgi:hypothetical protein
MGAPAPTAETRAGTPMGAPAPTAETRAGTPMGVPAPTPDTRAGTPMGAPTPATHTKAGNPVSTPAPATDAWEETTRGTPLPPTCKRSGTPRLPAHARIPDKKPWWNPGQQQGTTTKNPVVEARPALRVKRPREESATPQTPAMSLMVEAKNMKTKICQQGVDITTNPQTVAEEGDIARIIRMLKTWQTDDNFAAKDRQLDRTAWYRVAKCNKMTNEQAQECFQAAHARLDHPGSSNDLPQRALVDLMRLAAAVDEGSLASSMECLLTTLGSGTQTRPPQVEYVTRSTNSSHNTVQEAMRLTQFGERRRVMYRTQIGA